MGEFAGGEPVLHTVTMNSGVVLKYFSSFTQDVQTISSCIPLHPCRNNTDVEAEDPSKKLECWNIDGHRHSRVQLHLSSQMSLKAQEDFLLIYVSSQEGQPSLLPMISLSQ